MGKQRNRGRGDLGRKTKCMQGPCHHPQPGPALAAPTLRCLVLLCLLSLSVASPTCSPNHNPIPALPALKPPTVSFPWVPGPTAAKV